MFEEEGFTDIETAAFERSLSAPPVQGYSFSVSELLQVIGLLCVFLIIPALVIVATT